MTPDVSRLVCWIEARHGAQRSVIASHFGWTPNKTAQVIGKAGAQLEVVRTSPTVEVVYIPAHAKGIRQKLAHVSSEVARLNRRLVKSIPVKRGRSTIFELTEDA